MKVTLAVRVFRGKCAHFPENARILCKLDENARILSKDLTQKGNFHSNG